MVFVPPNEAIYFNKSLGLIATFCPFAYCSKWQRKEVLITGANKAALNTMIQSLGQYFKDSGDQYNNGITIVIYKSAKTLLAYLLLI